LNIKEKEKKKFFYLTFPFGCLSIFGPLRSLLLSSTGLQEATRGVSVSGRQNGKLKVVPSQQIRQKYETS